MKCQLRTLQAINYQYHTRALEELNYFREMTGTYNTNGKTNNRKTCFKTPALELKSLLESLMTTTTHG